MDDNKIEYDEVEFDEEKYQKNINENDFSGSEENGKGSDINANN